MDKLRDTINNIKDKLDTINNGDLVFSIYDIIEEYQQLLLDIRDLQIENKKLKNDLISMESIYCDFKKKHMVAISKYSSKLLVEGWILGENNEWLRGKRTSGFSK